MNAIRHVVNEIEVSEENSRDALRVIFHAILLARSLGPITPKSRECPSFGGLVYAQAPSHVDGAVEQAVDTFFTSVRVVGPLLTRGEMLLSFFERRQHTSLFGMVTEEERVFFEHWRIPLVVAQNPLPDVENEKADLNSVVLQIATLVNTKFDHLPPPPSTKLQQSSTYSFQFKLADDMAGVKGGDDSKWAWLKTGANTLPV
jgi:hypothetical protein